MIFRKTKRLPIIFSLFLLIINMFAGCSSFVEESSAMKQLPSTPVHAETEEIEEAKGMVKAEDGLEVAERVDEAIVDLLIDDSAQTNDTQEIPTSTNIPLTATQSAKLASEEQSSQDKQGQTATASEAVGKQFEPINTTEQQQASVTLSIQGDAEYGLILAATPIAYQDGDTVVEILRRAGEDQGFAVHKRGFGQITYIEGIEQLFEFDRGPTSGWIYVVNGTIPSKSAGAYKVAPNDLIEWKYTLDMGEDIGQR